MIRDIEAHTAGGGKYEPVCPIHITDDRDELVARVQKTIYIRWKPRHAGA